MTPFLTSRRLAFRHWTEADLPLAHSLWGDPEVALYLGGSLTLEATRAKLAVEMDRQRTLGIQYWPIFRRQTKDPQDPAHPAESEDPEDPQDPQDPANIGTFAGAAGLRPFHDQPDVRELGVHIARPFWSARLGEEAARVVIAYAFDTLHLEALVAGHNPGNTHSQALVHRLGFTYTHHEPWGPDHLQHPYYRLAPPLTAARPLSKPPPDRTPPIQ